MRRPGLFALGVMLLLADRGAAASLPVDNTAGQLAFIVHGQEQVSQTRIGDELLLAPALPRLDPGHGLPTGVMAIATRHHRTVIRLQHDMAVTTVRESGRLVLEIKPGGSSAPTPLASPSVGAAEGVLPGLPAPMIAVVDAPTKAAPVVSAPTAAAEPQTAPAGAPGMAASPVSIAASLVTTTSSRPAGLLLPFDRSVGAAAFRRGGRLEVVFDSRKPIDLSASASDPAFQQARLSLLAAGTLLDMPVDPKQPIALMRVADGWLLCGKTPVTEPASPEPQTDGLIFRMADAGEVLTVADPAGGGDLLVGTVRADVRNVVTTGRAPGYQVVPSILGVVVERLSDRVELRRLASGFRLIDPFPPIGGYRADPTAAFSRSVELPPVDQAEQWRRYKLSLASSASLPPGSRRRPRLDAARSALALGLGAEARMLAEAADKDAPDAADRSASAFLTGAGALLAGDADAARLLADPLIGNSDEAALWRSLAVGRTQADRPAARSVAALWGLLASYPEPVRRLLIGDASLLLAKSGDDAARSLVARLADPTGKTGLARALVDEQAGRYTPALTSLDQLFADRDPDISVSAGLEAIELRLRDHLITPEDAARRAERMIYDGRMAGREQEVALRAAQLHAQAKNWPAALSILRQQASAPGADLSDIKRMAGSVLLQAADAIPAGGKGSDAPGSADALGAVALLEQNQDLLPPDVDRVALSTRLADRLAADDLPGRATIFLRQAFAQSPAGADKARLGLALAGALLQQDDVAGARGTLDGVDRAVLSPAMAEQATLMDARLRSAAGDRQGAIAALAPLRDQDSEALRAALMADNKDWQGEASALTSLLAARRPAGPGRDTLDPGTEDVVLRLAGALSRSGQHDALRQLDRTWSPLFADHAKRDMVSLLAAPDVTSVGDLPRSARDITAARNALHALGGGGAG